MTREVNSCEPPSRIPGTRISEEEASIRYRYGSIRVLHDGRLHFSPKTRPGLPELDFSVEYACRLPDGTYVLDRANYAVDARWPGNDSFFVLWVIRHRVQSACFNFSLTPDEMRKAVDLLRKAGGGTERWIIPGLEYTREEFARVPSSDDRGPKMLKVLHELLDTNRDLPVAEPWKRLVRERERCRHNQAAENEDPTRKPRVASTRKARGNRR